LVRDEKQIPGFVQAKLFNRVDGKFLLLSDDFESLLMDMTRHGYSEVEITDKLLPFFIKTNRTRDIGMLLKRFNHISEKMLVKTLKYLIGCPEVKKKKPEQGKITVSKEEFQSVNKEYPYKKIFAKERFDSKTVDVLDILLSCTFDAKIIVNYLRQEIELNELIYLLDYLYEILAESCFDFAGHTEIAPSPVELETFDLDRKLFDWFTLLIDSHYQQILLTKDEDLLKRLVKWNELVEKHMKILKEMVDLRSLLLNIVNGKYNNLISKTTCNKWYSIEKIKLY
jgi:hypothetical protein